MNKKFAQKLIKKTRDDYNRIADHFASTRKKVIWPDVLESVNILDPKKGEKVLDLGAGSGRLYPLFEKYNTEYSGIDLSEDLVVLAKAEHPKGNFLIGDATQLPFSNCEFDLVVSVAVIYHIPSSELRQKALDEIFRVTKNDGKIYISVWYFWNKWKYVKLIIKEAFKILQGKSELEIGDFFMPWKTPDGKIQTDRFCHAWSLWGLKRALRKAGFKNFTIIKGYKNKTRNLNIICQK